MKAQLSRVKQAAQAFINPSQYPSETPVHCRDLDIDPV